MSAVVELVEDVVGAAVDLVEDVVDVVGDVVETVADVVVDAVEWVGDVVQAVVEDPLPVLLSVAGAMIGIPPYITSGVITAARGGDLGDIALSMGTSYIAAPVAGALSSTIAPAIGDSIINQAISDVVVDGVSRGLVNGTIAEIRGGDFSEGFAGAFTGVVVGAGVGELTNYVRPEIAETLNDLGMDADTITQVTNAGTRAVTAGLTAEITANGDFGQAFANSAINSGVSAGVRFAENSIAEQFTDVNKTNQEITGTASQDNTEERNTGEGAGIPPALVDEVEGQSPQTPNTMSEESSWDGLPSTGFERVDDIPGYTPSPIDDLSDVVSPDIAPYAPSPIDDLRDLIEPSNTQIAPQVDTMSEEPAWWDNLPSSGYGSVADIAEYAATPIDDLSDVVSPEDTPYTPLDIDNLSGVTSTDTDSEEIPSGGLAAMAQAAEAPVTDETDQVISSAKPPVDVATEVDQLSGAVNAQAVEPVTENGEKVVDVSGGLNEASKAMTGAGTPMGNKVVSGLRSGLRQGATRAITGKLTKPAVRQPVRRPAPQTLSAEQLATLKKRVASPLARTDVSKLMPVTMAPPKKAPPKKVDVRTLTPVSNISGLTTLLKTKK